jgi:hypothetical protein
LLGLRAESRYRLRFEDEGPAADLVLAGRLLMQEGAPVTLALPQSSELIFLEELP